MNEHPTLGTVFQDETGAYSTARCAFWITLCFSLWVVYRDATAVLAAYTAANVQGPWIETLLTGSGLGSARVGTYGFLSGIMVAEIVWAAGSKGISSLAPAVASAGQVFSAIAARAVTGRGGDTTVVASTSKGPAAVVEGDGQAELEPRRHFDDERDEG